MLELHNVRKSYRNGTRTTEIIRGVDLQIESGSFAVILGASGSGKSTLLSLMSGLEPADSGTIRWESETLTGMSDKDRTLFRRKHVGFVFQQYALLEAMTVNRNVRMGADLVHNQEYGSSIDAVGLSPLARERCSHLSGGEQQRVAIARAAAKKPDILFLDEPTGALDEKTGRQVLEYLGELHKQHAFTMVMVTHNEHIAQMADTVFTMNSGHITSEHKNEKRLAASEIGW